MKRSAIRFNPKPQTPNPNPETAFSQAVHWQLEFRHQRAPLRNTNNTSALKECGIVPADSISSERGARVRESPARGVRRPNPTSSPEGSKVGQRKSKRRGAWALFHVPMPPQEASSSSPPALLRVLALASAATFCRAASDAASGGFFGMTRRVGETVNRAGDADDAFLGAAWFALSCLDEVVLVCVSVYLASRLAGGVIEGKHSTDVQYPPPPPCVCMSIHRSKSQEHSH